MTEGKKPKRKNPGSKKAAVAKPPSPKGAMYLLLPILALTFILYIPALKNGFTNWDDIMYVTDNPLLKDLSREGLKKIFSTPVVSNYHPLTILSLALNYQAAELTPWSYHLTSILLHLVNTGLVFWFIMLLSGKNKWVSAATSLLFAIHPMHVESVAWISERKDLLYTLFYVLALISYVHYLEKKQVKHLIIVTVLGALSLLSKPAAIVLPLTLFLLDYYYRRPWNITWILEKLPLLAMSAVMAFVTLQVQSERAIASVEMHSFMERICFAGFGLIWYLIKLVIPAGLSALHPFPKELGVVHYAFTMLSLAGLVFLVLKVRNKNFVFGFGFYIINLLLVLQIISIGNAVVAERYTYVPYIGLFFLGSIELYKLMNGRWAGYKKLILGGVILWILALVALTWTRIPVWNNSERLWEDVLKKYPDSPRAWTNKGLIYYDRKEWNRVVEDLSKALASDPQYANALEWRARAYLELNEGQKALQDAELFYRSYPDNVAAMFAMARAYEVTGQYDAAVSMYDILIPKAPNVAEYLNNRGALYFNRLQRYEDAKKDFEQCIAINPNVGLYYLNLSRCYYVMGDYPSAKIHAEKARQLGEQIDPAYAGVIGLE